MQPVFDREIFEIAQPGINAPQRIAGIRAAAHTRLARDGAVLRGLDDQSSQPFAPLAIETVGLRVFVDEAFKLACLTRQFAAHERWRKMPDGHACNAAFGLCGFAGIADQEGINDGQRAGEDFGKAARRERHGLARQPFKGAVRSHMRECVWRKVVLQPQTKCQQRVAWRQRGIVIVRAPVA